jgi:hypothetical protein
MTVIEIKPHAWGWKVVESPGVEPVFEIARARTGKTLMSGSDCG